MKAPQPPDPDRTALAQFKANTGTALYQQILNQTNQVTPFSSLTYDRIGDFEYTDDKGHVWNVPRFQATQSSPMLEAYVNSPFDPDEASRQRLNDLGREFLDPMWDQQAQTYEANLLNRGIGMGTEAYRNAMQQFGDQRSRAYNDMALHGDQQFFNQAQTERQRGLNEILAAMSGVPLGQTPAASIAPPDYQGAVQANYQQRLANHQANMGALGNIVGIGLRGAMGGWGGP
jgi:hypothetical protein